MRAQFFPASECASAIVLCGRQARSHDGAMEETQYKSMLNSTYLFERAGLSYPWINHSNSKPIIITMTTIRQTALANTHYHPILVLFTMMHTDDCSPYWTDHKDKNNRWLIGNCEHCLVAAQFGGNCPECKVIYEHFNKNEPDESKKKKVPKIRIMRTTYWKYLNPVHLAVAAGRSAHVFEGKHYSGDEEIDEMFIDRDTFKALVDGNKRRQKVRKMHPEYNDTWCQRYGLSTTALRWAQEMKFDTRTVFKKKFIREVWHDHDGSIAKLPAGNCTKCFVLRRLGSKCLSCNQRAMRVVDQHGNYLEAFCLHKAFYDGNRMDRVYTRHTAPIPQENDVVDLPNPLFELTYKHFKEVVNDPEERKRIVDTYEYEVSFDLFCGDLPPNHHAWVDLMRMKDEVVEFESFNNPTLKAPVDDEDSMDADSIGPDDDDDAGDTKPQKAPSSLRWDQTKASLP